MMGFQHKRSGGAEQSRKGARIRPWIFVLLIILAIITGVFLFSKHQTRVSLEDADHAAQRMIMDYPDLTDPILMGNELEKSLFTSYWKLEYSCLHSRIGYRFLVIVWIDSSNGMVADLKETWRSME